MPNCYVDQLLLLCLERGQVYRKGIYISLKTVVNMYTLKWLKGHHYFPGGVFHCDLPLCDAAHSFDPRTLSSRGSTRSAVLSSARTLTTY